METIHVIFDEMDQKMAPVRMISPRGTSFSTTMAQDAPSTSASSSTSDMHHPVRHQGIAEEPTHEDSPINHDVHYNPYLKPCYWRTRNRSTSDALWCCFHTELSKIEPMNFKMAVIEDCWFQAMQDEIHEFDRLEVWELYPRPILRLQVISIPGGLFINASKKALEPKRNMNGSSLNPDRYTNGGSIEIGRDLQGNQLTKHDLEEWLAPYVPYSHSTVVDKYLGTKLDDALLKILERYTVDLIEKYSVLSGPESIKNQESKKSPKEIIRIKRNKVGETNSTYTPSGQQTKEALIADEDAMDKKLQVRQMRRRPESAASGVQSSTSSENLDEPNQNMSEQSSDDIPIRIEGHVSDLEESMITAHICPKVMGTLTRLRGKSCDQPMVKDFQSVQYNKGMETRRLVSVKVQIANDPECQSITGETGSPGTIQLVSVKFLQDTDGEMCMFALTVIRAKPKNIKEAMADHAWIEAMQEELHQFE
ncbi:hypothetical protein Tco_0092882 [Tanacetum coccineum]